MKVQLYKNPRCVALTIWVVVNAVNLLQAAGFFSRVVTGERSINRILGYGIVALAVPAFLAMVEFMRTNAGWRHWIGPGVFLVFVVFMVVVEYILKVEFRSPMLPVVLVPYLVLFFGSIFLMGVPMFWINRRLWFVTAATTVLLLGAMGFAMYRGVG